MSSTTTSKEAQLWNTSSIPCAESYYHLGATKISGENKQEGSSSTVPSDHQPIPNYEHYKVLREEELLAYRMVLRVFLMHNGVPNQFSKEQRRVLEDLQEMCCVSQDRCTLEQLSASADPSVLGVYHSGIANTKQKREAFMDATSDVVPSSAFLDTTLDGGSIITTATSSSHMAAQTMNTASVVAPRGGTSGKKNTARGGGISPVMATTTTSTKNTSSLPLTTNAPVNNSLLPSSSSSKFQLQYNKLKAEVDDKVAHLMRLDSQASHQNERIQLKNDLKQKENALIALKEEIVKSLPPPPPPPLLSS